MHSKSERSHPKRGRGEKPAGKATSESAWQWTEEEGVFRGPAKAVGTASRPASAAPREVGSQASGARKGRVCDEGAFVIRATHEN